MTPRFVHLHLHSEYSINDGLVRIKPLLQRCVTMEMPAIAMTDQNNFFGLIKFYRTALELGIKPIVGVDILISNEKNPKDPHKLTLLARNDQGYKNLLDLISRSYLEGQKLGSPLIELNWLKEKGNHLIALSGEMKGDIGKALLNDEIDTARDLLFNWNNIFPGSFYLEVQRTGKPNQEEYIQKIAHLAHDHNTPLVATNDVHFLEREDFTAHEARVCIHEGRLLDDLNRLSAYSEEQYLRSPEEMLQLFHDLPEAITNTVEIAKRCNAVISIGENYLPVFPLENNSDSIESYFVRETKVGFEKRIAIIFAKDAPQTRYPKEAYLERLEHEIKVIEQMGYVSYFLIVADFIRWAKQNSIPVGPGRGSGAGSLVAYALGITDIDPLEHELLFERFLNPERISLPDFDIDFCMDGRDRVIDYVAQRYGHQRVAQIVTHGTMAAKAVVRDVGRVLGFPYGFVDKIAKLIPFTLGLTLEDALNQEEVLRKRYREEEEVKSLIDLALKLEGITRNVGKHAGGVVIAPTKLIDFTPLYCEAEDTDHIITQFDKNDVEAIGLVKFDFLGLRTLTIIDAAEKRINRKRAQKNEPPLDITRIPLNDAKTFQLLRSCSTTAIFQLESRGMKDLIKRLQPDCFNDIVALVALYRPGPLQSGMVDDFIDIRCGRAKASYPHPKLESILRATYGVILYQEQVMQIAQVLSGYDLGSADILRSAMGKKKPEEMARQRAIFVNGAAQRGVDKHIANNIFDLMEKFAGYGFNKSHSVAYALLTYRTAWLKTHYPAEFMATVLSLDMDNTDKVVKLLAECKAMALKVIPPDINHSDFIFSVNGDGAIIYGLGAIKGVGQGAAENIIANRIEHGPYENLFDLCDRVDRHKINRKVLESLLKSGALDQLHPCRATMLASIDKALQLAEQNAKAKEQKQLSLFDDSDEVSDAKAYDLYIKTKPWTYEELLQNEKNTLGFYLSGHPID